VELGCRGVFLSKVREQFPVWAAKLGEDRVLDLGVLGEVSDTALTREQAIGFSKSGLPSTFVPGRNLVFLTFAGAVAYRRGFCFGIDAAWARSGSTTAPGSRPRVAPRSSGPTGWRSRAASSPRGWVGRAGP
jgi:hypothetical protein